MEGSKRQIIRNFIALEGIDGTGTTTQLAALGEKLKKARYPHLLTREPTDSPIGIFIRECLRATIQVEATTIARLFAADRGEHLYGEQGILDRTKNGELVISDRYLFSSLAYQGVACGMDLPFALNACFPLPELLVFFDIEPEISMERIASRKEKDIFETLPFQKRVALMYRQVVSLFEGSGMRILRLDANQEREKITEVIWREIVKILDGVVLETL
jgi:dTMP kinase